MIEVCTEQPLIPAFAGLRPGKLSFSPREKGRKRLNIEFAAHTVEPRL